MTTATVTDRYPSRTGPEASVTDRRDPVVHGEPGAGPLGAEELEHFDSQGFVLVEDVFSPTEVSAYLDELARLAADPAVRADDRTITEPESQEVRSIFEVHRNHAVFSKLAADERLAGVARQILGSDVYIHQSRVNFKPGFRGKEFSWHSDFETWHTEDGMPAPRSVSASIALTDNHEFNGPLMIIPGSHRRYVACVGETPADHYKASLKAQELGVPDDASLARLVEEAGGEIATLTGAAGSVVFFDCNCMHGSNSNISPYPRSNVFVVYNSVENTLVDPFAAPQPRPDFIAARDFTPV